MRLKGGILRFKGREFSILLIVLVCATILVWAWQKTPLLATVVPHNGMLQLSPDVALRMLPYFSETEEKDNLVVEVDKNSATEISTNLMEAEGKRSQNGAETEEKDRQVLELGENGATEISSRSTGAEGQQGQNVGENNLKEQLLDLTAPLGSANISSLVRQQDDKNFTSLVENQACNYAKGKWVVDVSLPLYSGFGCKQWLSPMWACRLTQRKDFAYEKLRWQPESCRVEEFEGSAFLERTQMGAKEMY